MVAAGPRAKPTASGESSGRGRSALLAPKYPSFGVAGPVDTEQALAEHPNEIARASERGNLEAVALLIELGWDVNAFTRVPALHEAAMRGNLALIRLLLMHGADPDLRDRWHEATAAGWAAHHGQPEAERLLRELDR